MSSNTRTSAGLRGTFQITLGIGNVRPLEIKETIAQDVQVAYSTQTVFLALESTIIHFWVLNKERKVPRRRKEDKKVEDAITFLECSREGVFKENNFDGRITCENRSLDELRDKTSPSSEFVEE